MLRVFLAAMTNIFCIKTAKSEEISMLDARTHLNFASEHAMTDVLPGDVIGIFYNNGNENFGYP